MIVGIALYYNSLLINLQEAACQSLDEVMQQEKNNFSRRLLDDRAALKGYAQLFKELKDGEQSPIDTMNVIAASTKFEIVSYARPDGGAINNKGGLSNILDREYFQAAMGGHTVISEPVKSKIRDANIIAIVTPLKNGNDIEGALVGSFNVEKLNALFMASFDGYGYAYIVTNSGEIIAKTDSVFSLASGSNLFDFFELVDFFKHDSYETMRQNLLEGQGGHSAYKNGTERRLMHYDKIGINDWNIFTIVNPKGMEAAATRIIGETILLTVGLLIVFAFLVIYGILSQRRFTKEIARQVFVDQVTGFRSFAKFKIDAQKLLQEKPDACYLLVKIDIENFKFINQMYSVEIGDKLLEAMAQSLAESLDSTLDAFGRIHADEFVLLVSDTPSKTYLQKQKQFEASFAIRRKELVDCELVISRGRYRVQLGETDFSKLFEKANFAHRLAKETPSKTLDFDGKVRARAIREREMELHMEQALASGAFQMFLQPKYMVGEQRIIGAESVARWEWEDGSVLYPSDFIALFEQNGFITRLDFYMFEIACKTLAGWIESGLSPIGLTLNFSPRHLRDTSFVEVLREIAARYGAPCQLMELEWSESAMRNNLDVLEDLAIQMHSAGFSLSIDGFGSGDSSLILLRNACVDTIKIDQSFFSEDQDFDRAEAVVGGMVKMACGLGIRVVAQGVETQEQLNRLSKPGCEIVQGFYYDKPMPAQQLEVQLMREFLQEK